MITLDATTKELQLKLDAGADEISFAVSYMNFSGSAFSPRLQDDFSNGTTAVTICPAPGTGETNTVGSIIVTNSGGRSRRVTIGIYDTSGSPVFIPLISKTVPVSCSFDILSTLGGHSFFPTDRTFLSAPLITPVTKTGDTALADTDTGHWLHFADATAQTNTLPAAADCPKGAKICCANLSAISYSAPVQHTFAASASDTVIVAGVAKTTLALLSGNSFIIESDGLSKWYAKSYEVNTPLVNGGEMPMTSTGTSPTKSTRTIDIMSWQRRNNILFVRYQYTQTAKGTAGTGTYLLGIPSGLTIDTSQLSTFSFGTDAYSKAVGFGAYWYTGVSLNFFTNIGIYDSTRLIPLTIPALNLQAAMCFYIEAYVPILGW